MSTPKPEVLAPECETLFPIHQRLLRFADSAVKDNKKGLPIHNFLSQKRRT